MRILSGQLRATTGQVAVAGFSPQPHKPEFRARIAGVIGAPVVAEDLTLKEHCEMVEMTWRHCPDKALWDSSSALEYLGLGKISRRFPYELSSGQTRLFNIALVLVRPFELLLLDEPEQHLDQNRCALLIRLINELLTYKKTVIFSSHAKNLIEHAATHSISLPQHGTPTATGTESPCEH